MQNRLELLRLYCAAVEANSFKDAATRLGASPQSITRAVQELESLVGEVLFHRNTRRVRATEAGEALAARARELVRQADDLLQPGRPDAEAGLSGLVRITAPKAIGETHLMPVLTRVAQQHPGITLDVRLSDQISDVIEERIDIGVRVGFMRDSRFVVRSVSKARFFVVATPKLIRRAGRPDTVQQLGEVPTTALLDRNTGRKWPWQFAQGEQFTPEPSAFVTDDPQAECQAVLAGLGYGQLASYLAQPYLRTGKLVSVLDALAPEPWPICVYRPQRGPVPPRIRLVFDAIVDVLSGTDFPSTD